MRKMLCVISISILLMASTIQRPIVINNHISNNSLQDCIKTRGEYPKSKIKTYENAFNKSFPNLGNNNQDYYWWGVMYECNLVKTKLVAFVYVMKGNEILLKNYSRKSHTVLALINDSDEIIKSADIPCPLFDDIGPAPLIAADDHQMLVGCFSAGTPGALSGILNIIQEYYLIDLADFKWSRIYRDLSVKENGKKKIIQHQDSIRKIGRYFRLKISEDIRVKDPIFK